MTASSSLMPVLRSLDFSSPSAADLENLSDPDWRKLLALTDRSQLTLLLGTSCRSSLPDWVRARIDGNLANNAIRHQRILKTYRRVAGALSARQVDFAVLKGFSHYPGFCADLLSRPQYDLDLYCLPDQIERGYAALMELGYEPFGRVGATALDHLPPLILKTGWRARGDYYDPDIPITIELHFRFWDSATERFSVSGSGQFWERRRWRSLGPLVFPALHPVDTFSYAAWHLVRHLVRGDVRAYHVYELGRFLESTAANDSFWRDWRDSRPSPRVEAIASRLAVEWFGCRVNPVVQQFIDALPPEVERWFRMFGFSPLAALERPNKDELFLHLSLLNAIEDRFQVIRRRVVPRRVNPYIADVHVASPDLKLRLKRRAVGAAFLAMRTWHHARTLLPLIQNAWRWRRARSRQPMQAGRTLRAETAPR